LRNDSAYQKFRLRKEYFAFPCKEKIGDFGRVCQVARSIEKIDFSLCKLSNDNCAQARRSRLQERPLTTAEAASDPPALAAWICILLTASLLADLIVVATAKVVEIGRKRPMAVASSCCLFLFAVAGLFGWYRSVLEGPFLVFFLLSLLAYLLVAFTLHTATSREDAAPPVPALARPAPGSRPAPLRQAQAIAGASEASRPPAPGDVVALNSGGPPMTISVIASGASEAVLLWFERGRCLEVRLPLAALSACRPQWRPGRSYEERPVLYAIESREESQHA
jgi:hypothetical protein